MIRVAVLSCCGEGDVVLVVDEAAGGGAVRVDGEGFSLAVLPRLLAFEAAAPKFT